MANSSESSTAHSAAKQIVDDQVSSSSKVSDPHSTRIGFSADSRSNGPLEWIQMQIENGVDPKDVLNQLIPQVTVPDDVTDVYLWKIVWEILSEPAPRTKLEHINSIQDVKHLITTCKNIVVLTGAGVSVSCGIPDFRSRDGVYARLSRDYPDLPDPQAMFDITYFRSNPWPFFKFAREIFPGQFTPSLSHRFISFLDKQRKLLRNYTQNIDTLEQVAGIKNVVQCHGSFARATCTNCKLNVDSEVIKKDIFDQKIPYCTSCQPTGGVSNIMKPDIVFFGENLPQDFYQQIEEDKDKVDLLIVIGSSLKVRPVSLIPSLIPESVPQVLINRESLPHVQFDVELLGNCDDVICELCDQMEGDWLGVNSQFQKSSLHPDVIDTINHLNRELNVDEDYVPPQERHLATRETSDDMAKKKEAGAEQDLNGSSFTSEGLKDSANQNQDKGENHESAEGSALLDSNSNDQEKSGNVDCSATLKEPEGDYQVPTKKDIHNPLASTNETNDALKGDTNPNVAVQADKTSTTPQKKSLIDHKEQSSFDEERKRKRSNSLNNLTVHSMLHSQTKKKRTLSGGSDVTYGDVIYYMRIPPNRYIFSGAELALDCESSGSEGDAYGEEESSGEEEELSDEEAVAISNEPLIPKEHITKPDKITESKVENLAFNTDKGVANSQTDDIGIDKSAD